MPNTTSSINLDEIPEAMTRSQLQKFTGVAFKTLNRWVDRGWLKVGSKTVRHAYFYRQDIIDCFYRVGLIPPPPNKEAKVSHTLKA